MQWPLKIIDSIRQYNFIEVELQGEIVEEEERFVIPFFPKKRKLTIWDLERIFEQASKSPAVIGVLIKIRSLNIGLGRAEDIRRGILELRERGKRVFVYLESPGNVEYMIGSAAERIFVLPWSMLNLIGLKAEVTFFKEALDKLGIEAQIKGLGEYKSASEMFTRKTMSEPHRDMIDSIIDDLYAQFVKYISQSRGADEERVKRIIDSGPFLSKEALEKGLVDELGYEEDLEERIEEILGFQLRKIRAESFLRILNVKEIVRWIVQKIRRGAGAIALVSDSGIIMLGESRGSGATKTLGSQTLIKTLGRIACDKNIKALVLRISSPGGSGVASDLVWHKLKSISEKKPVVVSMSDMAASGGYLIALGARKIVAEPMTLTGSIGIISGKFNLKGFFTKLGLTKDVVVRGNRALMFSSYERFTNDEEEKLCDIMSVFYEDFVNKVADARGMDFKGAEQLARGRVWTGKQAKEIGLIDELGGIKEAIRIAKKEAGISEDVSTNVKFFSKPRGIHLTALSRSFASISRIGPVGDFFQILKREAVYALMSFWIEVK
jgi:protease IV